MTHDPWTGTALMAGAAALGYWVLHHSGRDKGAVRIAGLVVGWALIAGGLMGFTCGVTMHSMKASGFCDAHSSRSTTNSVRMEMTLPANHPPIGKPVQTK